MSRRPLVFVLGLTIGDYLLWNWSLNGNHDVLALASGLTLPPLALVAFWLLAVAIARVLGRLTHRTTAATAAQRRQSRGYAEATARRRAAAAATSASGEDAGASRKIAA
ncbi:MAG TPA: hypothetical protein VN618_00045 [Solirubrobacteraceae bacterium]|nr:hypothetical protein [Solirubrobacteraceae bacterium]